MKTLLLIVLLAITSQSFAGSQCIYTASTMICKDSEGRHQTSQRNGDENEKDNNHNRD